MEVNPTTPEATRPGPKQRARPQKARKAPVSITLSKFSAKLQPELSTWKDTSSDKCYHLIWLLGNRFWLCAEDEKRYRKVSGAGGAIEAGRALAERLGVRFRE
jgi:hypothetical protein